MTGGACRDVSYFGNSPLYSSTLQNYRGTPNNTIFKRDTSKKEKEASPFDELRKVAIQGAKAAVVAATTSKYAMPDDYDKNFSVLKEVTTYERVKFLVFQRFTDFGFGTSPQIDRLFFKNEDFSKFCTSDFLIQNKYATTQTYLSFINKTNCEAEEANTPTHFRLNNSLTPGTFVQIKTGKGKLTGKIKKYNDDVDNAKTQDDAYDAWVNAETARKVNAPPKKWFGKKEEGTVAIEPPATPPPTAPKCKKTIRSLLKIPKCENFYTLEYKNAQGTWSQMNNVEQSDMKIIFEPSMFAFNDEYNIPFVNPYFFNFLHMFKYTLSKGFSKFRIWRVYRIIDGLVDIMTNTPYVEVSEQAENDEKKEIKQYINDKWRTITWKIKDNLNDYVIWKNTYLYALRRKFTNNVYFQINKMNPFGSETTSDDREDDLRTKNPCASFKRYKDYFGAISSLIQLSTQDPPETFVPPVTNKTDDDAEYIGDFEENNQEEEEEDYRSSSARDPNPPSSSSARDPNPPSSSSDPAPNPPSSSSDPAPNPPTNKSRRMTVTGLPSKKRFSITGGQRNKRRPSHRKTQKKRIHGGGIFLTENQNLYFTRAFRILTMHINTTNLMEAADTSLQKLPRFPAYLVLEQIRYITLAMYYFYENDRKNKLKDITDKNYSELDEFVIDYLKNGSAIIRNKQKVLEIYENIKKGNKLTSDFNFINDVTVHKEVLEYLKELNGKLKTISFKVSAIGTNDYGFLKKIFTHASNTMFYEYSERLFRDPRNMYPGTNLAQKLEEHYRLKGYYSNFKGVLKGRPHVADVLEFMQKFTFCLIMMPNFACSQLFGILIGFLLDSTSRFTALVTFALANTVMNSPFSSVKTVLLTPMKMIGFSITGVAVIAMAITGLINTPNCYIAMALMFFTLVRSLNPFMPYAGPRHGLRLRSDRMNSAYYKPRSNPLHVSLKQTPTKP